MATRAVSSKKLYWTDAHFCGLPSQSNIYGLSKITFHDGKTTLLAVSIDGHFVTVEYKKSADNRLIPITREDEFYMVSPLHGPASLQHSFSLSPFERRFEPVADGNLGNAVGAGVMEIVSVDMFYQDKDRKGVVLAVTYLKLADPYEEKAPSAYMNIYFLESEAGSHINLVDAVAMSQIQVVVLPYFPFKIMHHQIDFGDGQTETCFILSGNDSKIHVFKQTKDRQTFYEDSDVAEKYFPEFSEVNECVTQMEIKQQDSNHRLTALGVQRGKVTLFLVNTDTNEIERRWETNMDSPITSLQIFSHQVNAPMPDFLRTPEPTSDKEESTESKAPEPINLLITSAIDSAVVFWDVLESDLTKRHTLPSSNTQDVVLCSCIMDIDFDGENEILIGTYGQVLLAYKLTVEQTPGAPMTSTPFQSPRPVPVVTSTVPTNQNASNSSSANHSAGRSNTPTPPPLHTHAVLSQAKSSPEQSDRRRHKSLAGTLDSSSAEGTHLAVGVGSPNKLERQENVSGGVSLRDGQMARLVSQIGMHFLPVPIRSQENLAMASPRSVFFQTPDHAECSDVLPHGSLTELSDFPSYRLKWTKRFSDPVMGLTSEDMTGDGMMDLVVLTLKGLHILQPDLNEVADLLLERLRRLCASRKAKMKGEDVQEDKEAS